MWSSNYATWTLMSLLNNYFTPSSRLSFPDGLPDQNPLATQRARLPLQNFTGRHPCIHTFWVVGKINAPNCGCPVPINGSVMIGRAKQVTDRAESDPGKDGESHGTREALGNRFGKAGAASTTLPRLCQSGCPAWIALDLPAGRISEARTCGV